MLKPINNKIILKVKENEEKTKSGIIINNNNKENQKIGEIIAISNEIEKENSDIKYGKKIIFEKFSANEIIYNQVQYFILDIKDVLAIIDD